MQTSDEVLKIGEYMLVETNRLAVTAIYYFMWALPLHMQWVCELSHGGIRIICIYWLQKRLPSYVVANKQFRNLLDYQNLYCPHFTFIDLFKIVSFIYYFDDSLFTDNTKIYLTQHHIHYDCFFMIPQHSKLK